MNIKLTPQGGRSEPLTLSKAGDVLIINGNELDLSFIPEGGRLPGAAIEGDWFIGDIYRVDGELNMTLVLPLGDNPSPEAAFPPDLNDLPDGDVALPVVHVEQEVPDEDR